MKAEMIFICEALNAISNTDGELSGSALKGLCGILDMWICDEVSKHD